MDNATWLWIMLISVSGMWACVAIIRTVVDGIVKTKQHRMDLEREYLQQMMAEITEIKQRLNERTDGEAIN